MGKHSVSNNSCIGGRSTNSHTFFNCTNLDHVTIMDTLSTHGDTAALSVRRYAFSSDNSFATCSHDIWVVVYNEWFFLNDQCWFQHAWVDDIHDPPPPLLVWLRRVGRTQPHNRFRQLSHLPMSAWETMRLVPPIVDSTVFAYPWLRHHFADHAAFRLKHPFHPPTSPDNPTKQLQIRQNLYRQRPLRPLHFSEVWPNVLSIDIMFVETDYFSLQWFPSLETLIIRNSFVTRVDWEKTVRLRSLEVSLAEIPWPNTPLPTLTEITIYRQFPEPFLRQQAPYVTHLRLLDVSQLLSLPSDMRFPKLQTNCCRPQTLFDWAESLKGDELGLV